MRTFDLPARLLAAAILLPLLHGCGEETRAAGRAPLRVLASSELRDPLEAVERRWERDPERPPLELTFADGPELVAAAGRGTADVFLPAEARTLDEMEAAGATFAARRALFGKRLIVVVRKGRSLPGNFLSPRFDCLALPDPARVTSGRLAKEWLERNDAWDTVAGLVRSCADPAEVLAAVESGECEVGFLYASDCRLSQAVQEVLRVPLEAMEELAVPVAVAAGGPREAEALAFFEHLNGRGGEMFRYFGFSRLPDRAREE